MAMHMLYIHAAWHLAMKHNYYMHVDKSNNACKFNPMPLLLSHTWLHSYIGCVGIDHELS